MLYRVAIIGISGKVYSKNGTKDEIDSFILELMEQNEVKRYRIMNLETREIVENYPKY